MLLLLWVRELVNKSKTLQQEILVEGRGRGSEKEFYKKNSRSVLSSQIHFSVSSILLDFQSSVLGH
jgi:hypothetical protein